jgi:hypothetical protein
MLQNAIIVLTVPCLHKKEEVRVLLACMQAGAADANYDTSSAERAMSQQHAYRSMNA